MKPLNVEQYRVILKMLCPYCRYGLPDVRECDRQTFVHSIPGTAFRADCLANTLRGNVPVESDPGETFARS